MRTRVWQPQEPDSGVRFCLVFPREALSIPSTRRVLGDTLSRFGLDEESVADLLLAVTEACTNVVSHSGPGPKYEVIVQVGRTRVQLEVLDNGQGFDPARLRAIRRNYRRRSDVRPGTSPVALMRRRIRPADVSDLPESGRGMAIMRACVDEVSLRSSRSTGTAVRLGKRIELRDDAPLATLDERDLQELKAAG